MKAFAFTLATVLVGIWVWSKLTDKSAPKFSIKDSAYANADFQGPNIDPLTGSYLSPGSKPGSVSFPQDGNNGGEKESLMLDKI